MEFCIIPRIPLFWKEGLTSLKRYNQRIFSLTIRVAIYLLLLTIFLAIIEIRGENIMDFSFVFNWNWWFSILLQAIHQYLMKMSSWFFFYISKKFWTCIANCLKGCSWPPDFFWWCPYAWIFIYLFYVPLLNIESTGSSLAVYCFQICSSSQPILSCIG